MSTRVLLHVGTPKTGTSYLQDVLFRNRTVLEAAGILYPADRFDAHFLAALELTRTQWGGLERQGVGGWDRLAEAVRRHPGTAIVSHEILATATRAEADRAIRSLGHGAGTEVHLVISARDLVRQIPAEWQENLKHREELSYREFLDTIQDPDRDSRIGSWFWAAQELPDILDRWGHDLPPEQVHIITVPPAGGPRQLLWERFSTAFGLDGLELDLEGERSNVSLGVPETTLMRRINAISSAELEPGDYRPLVTEVVAHQMLSRRTGSARLALPPDLHPWVSELTTTWTEELRRQGYDVIGDLDDLVGAAPSASYVDPDQPDETEVGAAALDAIKALLLEGARLRRREGEVQAELDEAYRALERSYLRPTYRWRERTVRRLQDSGFGRTALGAYRRARGRSSAPE
ncbi:hypothetical protein [Nocardioides sp. URHA0020]|uniref:hypothetical protein n=1 Tax=Nocardioides sp. URHA0020 TaxID=1380392 RepID=UPI00048D3769|nr:hypothetical protein [Nocardioides sp. URHA0020]